MTSKILATSVFALLIAGCGNDHAPTVAAPAATAPTLAPNARIPTAGATRVVGDLMPRRLVAVPITAPTETALLRGSDALAPKKPFQLDNLPEPVVARDMRRVMKGSNPASYTFPIDAPQGARVIVHPVDPNLGLASVHLVDATSGAQLDRARDVSPNRVNSRHVPHVAEAPKGAPLDGRLVAPSSEALTPIPLEPGFEQSAPSLRVLTFDQPTNPGLVRVVVPADVQAQGIWVEVQQPNSHFTLSAVPNELNYGFGDVGEITATLLSDSAPISGATIEGTLELPDHTTGSTLSFDSIGNGKYVAKVPLASADWKYIGAWSLRLHATGTHGGAAFERNAETAFGYYPSHAQITALGTPVITRGADGLIDDIAIEADVETLAADRFSLRGTLTFTAADGTEHPLAAAQTGQTLGAGTGTIALHFDAQSLALARVDGPFHLRDVALVSQAGGITQHRIGQGLNLVTAPIAFREIRFPKLISLQAQDLIDNGDLAPIKY